MADIVDDQRKCALYVRVSTSNQVEDGESLEEQEQTLRNYCSFRGWGDYAIYREEGFSGKDLKRPAFKQMIKDIQKGKINTVIVKKIDRLSRSIIDFEHLYSGFQEKNIDLISTQENFDTSTAIGRSVIRIVLIFAQLEREQTSERTIDVMAHRAKQGLFNGGYPRLGYDNYPEANQLVLNENEALAVRDIFETYVRVGSLSETAILMNEKGLRMKVWTTKSGSPRGGQKFQKSSISRILNDPIHIGKIRYKNKIYEGQHEACIPIELFEAAQSILHANSITKTGYRQAENTFFLKGLVRCGVCKSAMATSFAYSKGRKYFYYRCNVDNDRSKEKCRIGSVSAPQLEKLVINEIKELSKNPLIINRVVEQATHDQRKKLKELPRKKKTFTDKIREIDSKAKNLVDILSIGGRDFSSSEYILIEIKELESQKIQLMNEMDSIDFQINEMENKIVSADIIKNSLIQFTEVYDQLTNDEKYDLLHLLIKKIVYFEDVTDDSSGKKMGKIKMDLWELPPIGPSSITSADNFAESSVWLPLLGSNQRQSD